VSTPSQAGELAAMREYVRELEAERDAAIAALDRLAIEAEARAAVLRELAALRRADPVFEDGRPNPHGYEGGWNDAIDEALALLVGGIEGGDKGRCDAIDDAWSMARCGLPRGHEGLHDAEPAEEAKGVR
jgi:hypothetical protein